MGSRQEESQRIGRIVRPKSQNNKAYFFNLVSEGTEEEIHAQNRKRFLIEQGYLYHTIQDNKLNNYINFFLS